MTWNECGVEISRRIAKATGAMAGFNTTWKSKAVSNQTKKTEAVWAYLQEGRLSFYRDHGLLEDEWEISNRKTTQALAGWYHGLLWHGTTPIGRVDSNSHNLAAIKTPTGDSHGFMDGWMCLSAWHINKQWSLTSNHTWFVLCLLPALNVRCVCCAAFIIVFCHT